MVRSSAVPETELFQFIESLCAKGFHLIGCKMPKGHTSELSTVTVMYY